MITLVMHLEWIRYLPFEKNVLYIVIYLLGGYSYLGSSNSIDQAEICHMSMHKFC